VLTGRNHLRKLRVKLSSPSVAFRYQEAVLQGGEYPLTISFTALIRIQSMKTRKLFSRQMKMVSVSKTSRKIAK
jgi:hypothetical protein